MQQIYRLLIKALPSRRVRQLAGYSIEVDESEAWTWEGTQLEWCADRPPDGDR